MVSIFCREPSEAEQDRVLTIVPEAVVDVVSQGYEAKDLEIGPPFYLSQGVKDVLVFDPRTLLVLHLSTGQARRLTSPVTIDSTCGCSVTIKCSIALGSLWAALLWCCCLRHQLAR